MKKLEHLALPSLALIVVLSFGLLMYQALELAKSEGQWWHDAIMCASYQVCPAYIDGNEGYQRWMRSIELP